MEVCIIVEKWLFRMRPQKVLNHELGKFPLFTRLVEKDWPPNPLAQIRNPILKKVLPCPF